LDAVREWTNSGQITVKPGKEGSRNCQVWDFCLQNFDVDVILGQVHISVSRYDNVVGDTMLKSQL
jgi:hypothetical protein